MEYVSKARNDKYMTRRLEEYAECFFCEMNFKSIADKSIFRVLRYCVDKITCYRHIDETLKENLENQQGNFSEMIVRENWFISSVQHDKDGNRYIFALRNGASENNIMKEYVCYQVNCFFKSLCDLTEKENGDANIYIKNMLYENAIAFVDRKLSGIINMSMSPRVILADSIAEISYMHYESKEANCKYVIFGMQKQVCDITFLNNNITLRNHKQIRKLLEITYKEKDSGLYLMCNKEEVEGYIMPENLEGEFYLVEFNGKGKWSFCYQGSDKNRLIFNNKTVTTFKNNNKEKFCYYYRRIFKNNANIEKIWTIVENARQQKHGTMLVFTEKAIEETKRLHAAGYQVSVSNSMSARWINAVSEIDGAILLDQYGNLYMLGVILDGEMPPNGVSTARGARYNSAIKYSYSHRKEKHLIVVISEDSYFNIINYNELYSNHCVTDK